METTAIEEYRSIRQEISQRVVVLHNQLNLACILMFVMVLVISLLGIHSGEMFNWILLNSFLPFICLGYNYQANQMTLEALAKYCEEKLHPDGIKFGWDDYWGVYKSRVRLISFMKVFGLLLPVFSIVIWSILAWSDFTSMQKILAGFNWLLFVIGVVNYRYKFGRI